MPRADRFTVVSVCALLALATVGTAASGVDRSLPENGGASPSDALPFTGLDEGTPERGLLDDFNRPDGPLGPNWTVQWGSFAIVSQAARGTSMGLATHASGTGDAIAMDIASDGSTEVQYAAAVLNYGGGATNLFIKIQAQDFNTNFNWGGCYTGNNNGGALFGLGFFSLTQPFASAHMEVSVDAARTVTINLTNIDGGALPDQQYVCTGAPPPEGPAIGMAGLSGRSSIDNFAIPMIYPMVRTFAYPAQIEIPLGLDHNTNNGLIGTDNGSVHSLFAMHPTSPVATIFFGPIDVSATSQYPLGVTYDGTTVYVTDATGDDVDIYDSAATYISSFSVAAHTTFPEGIAWNHLNNHLYIVNGSGSSLVHEFTTAGAHITDYAIPGISPDGLAWDYNRECFWFYDSGTDSIRQFTPTFTQMSHGEGTIAAGVSRGEGVAVIGDLLYVVAVDDDLVVEFDVAGARSATGFVFSDGFEWNDMSGWDTSSP
jgi:DNA-binding beta-propeller fold protein YncE